MNNFNEMTLEERQEITALFHCWLKNYTHEVVVKAMRQYEEIVSNELATNLLRELAKREQEEKKEELDDIAHLISDFEAFKMYDIHNHPLTHSQSYRDILHDMYL